MKIMKKIMNTLTSRFDSSYKTYEFMFKIGILLIILSIISAVASVQLPFDIPSWASMILVVSGLAGVIICVYSGMKGMKLLYEGKAYDDGEKRLLGRAAVYAMILTIVFSIVLIPVIDFFQYNFTTRTVIMIPLTMMAVFTGLLFQYFKMKSDLK